MKKIAFILLLSFISANAFGQDYYQTDGSTITVDGITFKVERTSVIVALDDVENKYGDAAYVYKDGRPFDMEQEFLLDMQSDPMSLNRAYTETFTKEEYLKLKAIGRSPLTVSFVVNSEGKVIEVAFFISAIPEMLSIPPSKFALLAKNMKKYVKCTLNPLAKQLQFIGGINFANFSNGGLYYPGDSMPPIDDNQLDVDDGKPRPPGFYKE